MRAPEIERFLDQRIKKLLALEADPEYPEAQLSAAAAAWHELPQLRPTNTGRVGRDCHRWYVQSTLEYLVSQGRARREAALDVDAGEAYVLNDRFRIGLADVSEALIAEMAVAADETGQI